MSFRVLIVEDDPMVAAINRSFTEQVPGFAVLAAVHGGDEAMAVLNRTAPDLVLLDVYLPQISGLQILKEIRRRELPTDVVLITAAQDSRAIQEGLRYGVVDYLIKPYFFPRFQQALLAFRRRREELTARERVQQSDLDALLTPVGAVPALPLPKGLNQRTLTRVITCLREATAAMSAEEIAQRTGVSRVTAWRYLDYLTGLNRTTVTPEYGSVGRPSYRFQLQE